MLPDAVIARAVRILLCASTLALVFVATPRLGAQGAPQAGPAPAAPNYVLASQWTSPKVSKLVFDTSVTPRWLEASDRFWYSYQTREGRRFYLVDPLKKAKTPLFDHAKMAAALTSITRIPYDAQHLPFSTVRFVKNDAVFEFNVQVPATANINSIKPREITTISSRPRAAADRRMKTRSRVTSGDRRDSAVPDAAGAGTRQRRLATRRSTSSTTWPPGASRCSKTTRSIPGRRGGRRCPLTTRSSSSPATTTCS